MRYLPLTDAERGEMCSTLGISDVRELFGCIAPERCFYPLDDFPPALSESELIQRFRGFSLRNSYPEFLSFLGAGAYPHFIPEVVNSLSAKGEFLTPYTPYQPEVSQGNLQAMFEYQTMMTMLTGMDVSNASLYDGGTAASEGALLTIRKSGKPRILISSSLHPEYAEIIRTYVQNLHYELLTVGSDRSSGKVDITDLERKLDERTAAFLFQSPNFFGVIEDNGILAEAVHRRNGYAVQVVAEAMSLPFLVPPGRCGVDVVAGEAQSFGLPLSFGGPYLGFLAARDEFLRQMPGRIVGETRDADGKRGYVLTLSTREQHIKREKATSNICTNQAWCAIRAAMYLATMGKVGLTKISRINHQNAAYFVRRVSPFSHVRVRYGRDFFNEVVLEILHGESVDFYERLRKKGILAGIPLGRFFADFGNALLISFTEMHDREMIDRLVAAIGDRP